MLAVFPQGSTQGLIDCPFNVGWPLGKVTLLKIAVKLLNCTTWSLPAQWSTWGHRATTRQIRIRCTYLAQLSYHIRKWAQSRKTSACAGRHVDLLSASAYKHQRLLVMWLSLGLVIVSSKHYCHSEADHMSPQTQKCWVVSSAGKKEQAVTDC